MKWVIPIEVEFDREIPLAEDLRRVCIAIEEAASPEGIEAMLDESTLSAPLGVKHVVTLPPKPAQ